MGWDWLVNVFQCCAQEFKLDLTEDGKQRKVSSMTDSRVYYIIISTNSLGKFWSERAWVLSSASNID